MKTCASCRNRIKPGLYLAAQDGSHDLCWSELCVSNWDKGSVKSIYGRYNIAKLEPTWFQSLVKKGSEYFGNVLCVLSRS